MMLIGECTQTCTGRTPARQDGRLRLQTSNLRCPAAFQRFQLKGTKTVQIKVMEISAIQHLVLIPCL